MSFKSWLVRKLGGYTEEQFDRQLDYGKELREELSRVSAKYDAIQNAHDATLSWFQQPMVRIVAKEERFRMNVAVALEERAPVDYIKRNVCQQMVDHLMAADLVRFDIRDDPLNGGRIYCGTLEVTLPKSF